MREFESQALGQDSLAEEKTGAAALPKHHPDRIKIARQVATGRNIDKQVDYDQRRWLDNRTGWEYASSLHGISSTLDYVRNYTKSKLVLDIGTGSSEGISDIAKSSLGEGLEFKATSLTAHPRQENNLGTDNITLTAAEILRGVEPESIGCIIAVRSLGYSATPKLTLDRLDEVLVPGGLIKAVFRGEYASTHLGENTLESFEQELISLGYEIKSMSDGKEKSQIGILLAKKPYSNPADQPAFNGANNSDLTSILNEDFELMGSDIILLKEEKKFK